MLRRFLFGMLPAALLAPKAAEASLRDQVEAKGYFKIGVHTPIIDPAPRMTTDLPIASSIINPFNKSVDITILGTEYGDVSTTLLPCTSFYRDKHGVSPHLVVRVDTPKAELVSTDLYADGSMYTHHIVGPGWERE